MLLTLYVVVQYPNQRYDKIDMELGGLKSLGELVWVTLNAILFVEVVTWACDNMLVEWLLVSLLFPERGKI